MVGDAPNDDGYGWCPWAKAMEHAVPEVQTMCPFDEIAFSWC